MTDDHTVAREGKQQAAAWETSLSYIAADTT